MENWRKVWREGVTPLLSDSALEALRRGLVHDDARLIQGATTTPIPAHHLRDQPVQGACGLGYCGWIGEELDTVGEVNEFFARLCHEIDQRLGEPAGCRHFLAFFDDTTRDEMRRLLLAEVNNTIAQRLTDQDQLNEE